MAEPTRKLSAKAILADIRSGMTDAELMQNYELSHEGLQRAFQKLLEVGRLSQSELDERAESSRPEEETAPLIPMSKETPRAAIQEAGTRTADESPVDSALQRAWKVYAGTALGYPLAIFLFWLRSDGEKPASIDESVRSMELSYFFLLVAAALAVHFLRKRRLSSPAPKNLINTVTYRPLFEQWYIQITMFSVLILGTFGVGGFLLLLFHMVSIPAFLVYTAISVAGIAAFRPQRGELQELALVMRQGPSKVRRPTAPSVTIDVEMSREQGLLHLNSLRKLNRALEIGCYAFAGIDLLVGAWIWLALAKGNSVIIFTTVICVASFGLARLFRRAAKNFDQKSWRWKQTLIHLPIALIVSFPYSLIYLYVLWILWFSKKTKPLFT